ncbi:hypothetical protein [Dinghuibacter silviterrae]|uniref:Uncharacterized protein n=1 Tax=Dinghuibacter silviterrae TaxID=1539049 RepID=A0A4R8DQN6_9BACT|nr:hypothetical protein [Dinghuibacter silviterrae]TDX00470.1 hypothetical protein EDB95_1495 [Dinghuibacter silviterrae]
MLIVTWNGDLLEFRASHEIQVSDWKAYKLPAISSEYGLTEEFGDIMYYEWQVGAFLLKYHAFNITKAVELSLRDKMDCPELYISVWAGNTFDLNGLGRFRLKLNEFGLWHLPVLEWKGKFPRRPMCGIFRIPLSIDLLNTLAFGIEVLEQFAEYASAGKPVLFTFKNNPVLSAVMIKEVGELIGKDRRKKKARLPDIEDIYLESVTMGLVIQAVKMIVDASPQLKFPNR